MESGATEKHVATRFYFSGIYLLEVAAIKDERK